MAELMFDQVKRIIAGDLRQRTKEDPLFHHIAIAVLGKSRWSAQNSYKTSPHSRRTKESGFITVCSHAEVVAINKLPYQMRAQAILFVARVRPSGAFANSKPCSACQRYLNTIGLSPKHIWYTDIDGVWQCLGTYQI